MSLFGFAPPVDIEIRLDGEHERNQVDVKLDNQAKDKLPVYYDGENVQGTVRAHRRAPLTPDRCAVAQREEDSARWH